MHLTPLFALTLVTLGSARAVPVLGERDIVGLFTEGTGNAKVGSEPPCPPDQEGPSVVANTAPTGGPLAVTGDNFSNLDIFSPDCAECTNADRTPKANAALLNVNLDNIGNIKLGDGPLAGAPGLPGMPGLPDGGVPGLPDLGKVFGGNPLKNIAVPGVGGDGDGTVVNAYTPGGAPSLSITPVDGLTANLNPHDPAGGSGLPPPLDDPFHLTPQKNNASPPPAADSGSPPPPPAKDTPAPANGSNNPPPSPPPPTQQNNAPEPAPKDNNNDSPPPPAKDAPAPTPTPADDGNANADNTPPPAEEAPPTPPADTSDSKDEGSDAAPPADAPPADSPPPPATENTPAPADGSNTPPPPPAQQNDAPPPPAAEQTPTPAESNPDDNGGHFPTPQKNNAGLPPPLDGGNGGGLGDLPLLNLDGTFGPLYLPVLDVPEPTALCPLGICPYGVIPCPKSVLSPLDAHAELEAQPNAHACIDVGLSYTLPGGYVICPRDQENFLNVHAETDPSTFLGRVLRLCLDVGVLPKVGGVLSGI